MCSNDCIIDMFGQRIIRWVAHCSQYMTNDLYFQAVWRNVLATVDCEGTQWINRLQGTGRHKVL